MKKLSQNILILLFVIGIVISVNFISSHYSKRWDLTDEKEFTLSESTLKVIDRLEDRVTIKLYYSKDLPALLMPIKERVDDILKEFKAFSKQDILVESIDPTFNDQIEQEALSLGITPIELNVIEKDKREVKKAYMGMVIYYQDRRQVIPILTQVQNMEYLMDLSILKLTQKTLPNIGVYIGGQESNYQLIPEVIKQLGNTIPIKADSKDLDKLDLAAFIVIHPENVTKEFLIEWDHLLESGVPLLLFTGTIDITDELKPEPFTTGIEDWLVEKGVLVSDKLLLDLKQNAQAGFQTGLVQVYLDYPFWVRTLKKDLSDDNVITTGLEEILFPWSNVLTLEPKNDSGWQYQVLATSSKTSFLQPDGEEDSVSPQYVNEMQKMPVFKQYPLSVALTKKQNDDAQKKYGQLFVTANDHLIEDRFLQREQANVLYLSNMIEIASWGDVLIGIRSRGKTARPLMDLEPSTKSQIKWGLTVFVPILTILIGLFVLYVLKKRRDRLILELT